MTLTAGTEARASRRRGRREPRWALALAGLYAAATVAALGSWAVVGDSWWVQPVNLTTFWWSLPAVPLALLAASTRAWRTAAALAVPALLWVWAYGGLFLPGSPAAEADLRVATFNTYVHTADVSHVLDLVERHDPDVLLLQEVFPPREAELDRLLADRYQTRLVVQTEGVGGVGVYSRFPVLDRQPVSDPVAASRATQVITLEVDGRPVQVVPVHLISPCPTCGTSVLERLELEGDVRRAEIGAVLDVLDPEVPAVVAGDFNSTERSMPYRRLVAAGFSDPHREAGSGPGFTWPNGEDVPPVFRIDWILTRGLEAADEFVADGGGSDHLPVIADLRLPEERP